MDRRAQRRRRPKLPDRRISTEDCDAIAVARHLAREVFSAIASGQKTSRCTRAYLSLFSRERGPSEYEKTVSTRALKIYRLLEGDDSTDFASLPEGSFRIEIHFSLQTAWKLHGVDPFWPHERPMMIDVVLGLPVMPGGAWKGFLRRACREECGASADQVDRIFGAEACDATGRLVISDTLFDGMRCEQRFPVPRVGTRDVRPFLEDFCPPGSAGRFRLAYVVPAGIDRYLAMRQGAEDLALLARAIETVLHRTGFSAESTRGYGIARTTYQRTDEVGRIVPGGSLTFRGMDFGYLLTSNRFGSPRNTRETVPFVSPRELLAVADYVRKKVEGAWFGSR